MPRFNVYRFPNRALSQLREDNGICFGSKSEYGLRLLLDRGG